MTSRAYKKLQKLSETLAKQAPHIKLKDLAKFVDLVASNIDDCFDLELFEFSANVQLEQDNEGIVRYLIETVSVEPAAKKCIALEIIHQLISDGPTREKFMAHKMLLILVSLLPSVTGGERIKEALGVQILRVIAYLAGEHSAFVQPTEQNTAVVRAVIALARSLRTENEPLQLAIGAALMPFYLHKGFNTGDTWNHEPIKYLLMAAQSGQVRMHREIAQSEVSLEAEIFQSPLCKVYRGTWNGHSVAIKKFSQYSLGFSWEDFYKEVGLLSVAQHPNVVLFHGAYANNGRTEEPFIVLEFLAKGDLHDVVLAQFKTNALGFSYLRLTLIAVDIAKGLAYLHQLGIIHRDIKTSNFLMADDMTVKMIDFGVSRVISTSVIMTTVGTPTFMAPEVLQGRMYTETADVYSFAMVMYECLVGKEPFEDINSLQLAGKVIEGLRPPVPANHPYTGYIQIMQQCWQADEKQRPSFKEALVALFQLKRTASDAPPSAATAAPVSGSSASVASTTSSAPAAVAANHQHQHASTSLNHSSHNNLPHTNNHSQVNNSVQPLARTTSGHKPSSTDPRDYDWYYGQLSKDDAINLLMGKPIGHFLFADGIRHILIQPGNGGRYLVDALDNKNYNFKSIPAVVKSYSNILKVPVRRPQSIDGYGTVPAYNPR